MNNVKVKALIASVAVALPVIGLSIIDSGHLFASDPSGRAVGRRLGPKTFYRLQRACGRYGIDDLGADLCDLEYTTWTLKDCLEDLRVDPNHIPVEDYLQYKKKLIRYIESIRASVGSNTGYSETFDGTMVKINYYIGEFDRIYGLG
ncbi:MAG: hypothetical protein LBF72_03725 [Holosporales bacterium]|jgi:hypothetical protein|nr:hypothetical protein [Holosporales bacterium]